MKLMQTAQSVQFRHVTLFICYCISMLVAGREMRQWDVLGGGGEWWWAWNIAGQVAVQRQHACLRPRVIGNQLSGKIGARAAGYPVSRRGKCGDVCRTAVCTTHSKHKMFNPLSLRVNSPATSNAFRRFNDVAFGLRVYWQCMFCVRTLDNYVITYDGSHETHRADNSMLLANNLTAVYLSPVRNDGLIITLHGVSNGPSEG